MIAKPNLPWSASSTSTEDITLKTYLWHWDQLWPPSAPPSSWSWPGERWRWWGQGFLLSLSASVVEGAEDWPGYGKSIQYGKVRVVVDTSHTCWMIDVLSGFVTVQCSASSCRGWESHSHSQGQSSWKRQDIVVRFPPSQCDSDLRYKIRNRTQSKRDKIWIDFKQ